MNAKAHFTRPTQYGADETAILLTDSARVDDVPVSEQVRMALQQHGLETPMASNHFSAEEKRRRIEENFADILDVLGLDLADDSLKDTPRRIAKMYIDEIFSGLDYSQFPSVSVFDNKMGTDEMIKVSDINLISTCEHHFVTIDGMAKVAYIPADKIIGLSKINRIVAFFAQRPQVQERLNQQILVALQTLLKTDDVAVSINAMHYCVKARGVQDSGSHTTTLALGGKFKNDPIKRAEFMT